MSEEGLPPAPSRALSYLSFAALAFLLLLLLVLASREKGRLEVIFPALSCGESILVKYSSEALPRPFGFLIDGGCAEAGKEVLRTLRREGIRRLELMLLTHPHPDHFGGLVAVLEDMPVERLLENGMEGEKAPWEAYSRRRLRARERLLARRGMVLWEEAGARVIVLSPWEPLSDNPNRESVVVKLNLGAISFLFTGDIDAKKKEELLPLGPKGLRSQILKVSHHGEGGDLSPPFLRAVSPQVAVILRGNPLWQGPGNETLRALKEEGALIHRADRDGDLRVLTDGRSYRLSRKE